MKAHVKRKLLAETAYEPAGEPLGLPQSDIRAELAAQFIPAGAKVLDLSAAPALERTLPYGAP